MREIKDRMNPQFVENLLKYAIEAYRYLGYKIDLDQIDFCFIDNTENIFGATGPIGPNKYQIGFNVYLTVIGCEDLLLNTMLHELGHYVQFEFAVQKGILIIDEKGMHYPNGDDSPECIECFGTKEDAGHGKVWLDIVDKVNNLGLTTNKITAFGGKTEREIFIKANKNNVNYIVKCLDCGFEDYFLFMNGLIQNIILGELINLPKSLRVHCPQCKSTRIDVIDKSNQINEGE